MQIRYAKNTHTLLFSQAGLKQTLFYNNKKKKVKVKLTFKVNTVIKPVTQGKNTVMFRPHEYVKRGSYNADTELSEEIFHVVYVAFCSAHRCI